MFRNLCISSAGTQGPVLMGALIELKNQGKLDNIRDMSGVSFGSILAFLLSVGWDPTDLCNATKDIDTSSLCKPHIRDFFNDFGLASSDDMLSHIDALTKQKNIDPNITFRNHLYQTDTILRIPALCLNTCKLEYFSHLSHPDLPVREAIRASMSIPLLFKSPLIDNKRYVDGGTVRNTPYDPYVGYGDETVCVSVVSSTMSSFPVIGDIQAYITALTKSITKTSVHVPKEFPYSIELHTPYSGYDFSIKQKEIQDMIHIGIQTVQEWDTNLSE